MNTNSKITKKEMFERIKALCADNQEVVNFCDHELELLVRKTEKKKMTSVQKANEEIKEKLYKLLTSRAMTVTEILKNDGFENFSNQKISALLRQLVIAGRVTRFTDKRSTYFIVDEENEG